MRQTDPICPTLIMRVRRLCRKITDLHVERRNASSSLGSSENKTSQLLFKSFTPHSLARRIFPQNLSSSIWKRARFSSAGSNSFFFLFRSSRPGRMENAESPRIQYPEGSASTNSIDRSNIAPSPKCEKLSNKMKKKIEIPTDPGTSIAYQTIDPSTQKK